MVTRTRPTLWAFAFASALVAVACSDDVGSTTEPDRTAPTQTEPDTSPASSLVASGQAVSGPAPADMCAADSSPVAAAYDLASGAFQWAACGEGQVRRDVVGVSDEAVEVEVFASSSGPQQLLAFAANDGSALPASGTQPTLPGPAGPGPDGYRVEGGQDDPTSVFDTATGELVWTHPGSPVYDDVWAVGDGAVFVMKLGATPPFHLIAYELASGDTRWEIEPDPADVWPWYVDGNVLYAIWTNLALISTADGSTIWRTDYPNVEFPRITGVRANSDTVFVAFSTVASGGD